MSKAVQWRSELAVAWRAAQRAGALQLARRSEVGAVQRKVDDTPVSEVDTACEVLIREELLAAFPDDGLVGEELPPVAGSSGRIWVVDPLDGTRPFLRGIPTHSALVSLEVDGTPVVGVIHLPALGETYWGSAGSGAFLNGQRLRVSTTRALAEAMGSTFGAAFLGDEPLGTRLLALEARWSYSYGFMDAYSHG